MPMFTLAISCLTTSNLPWFMDLTFRVPMQYCSLQHQTLPTSPVTSTAGLALAPSLHSFCSCFSLFSSSTMGTYQPGEFIFQCHIFLLFILFMGFSRQEYWKGLPFPSPMEHICQNSPPWPVHLGGPRQHGSYVIELMMSRHEFEQAPGVGNGQGSLAWCSPWGHKELDTTEWLNWSKCSQWTDSAFEQSLSLKLKKVTKIPIHFGEYHRISRGW